MPTNYHPRRAPCTHCGDTVVIKETTTPKLFGLRIRRAPQISLEHADPAPNGEVFDPVDDDCERAPVRGPYGPA